MYKIGPMPEAIQNTYEQQQNYLAETIGELGPWQALKLFSDPSLSGLERMQLFDATKQSIWRKVDYGNQRMIDDHLLVIEYMDRALAAEILADLARAKQTGIQPLATEPIPIISVASSSELV